ncbi:hypothetical protein J4433_01975 [Candidatus Pacearchaeota archaeon]|nr:hypothetical protein [Candidatus Pacearchaeota archaeon]
MAIKPKCDACKNELEDYGALLFSPPDKKNLAKKWHICQDCYKKLVKENFEK